MTSYFRKGGWGGTLALAGLVLALVVGRALVLRYDHSLHSIDGVLQTWFALDHFARGEQLGTGFQSYLGVTMILALLPMFVGLGETLYASTVAAHGAVVVGAFAAAYGAVWLFRPIPARHRWLYAILLVFAFYYVLSLAARAVGYPYPLEFDPGVSLRSVRGFLPFFVLPVFVVCLRAAMRRDPLVPGFALGLAAGAGLLWSNDAGIPLVLALGLALTLALLRRPARLAKLLLGVAAGAALSASAIVLAVTHGDPRPWLHYNFRDVAGDQFWYFAPWDRATRIFGPLDLVNILWGDGVLSLACLVVLVACVLLALGQLLRGRGSPVRMAAFVFVGASVVGTALIPQVGGHIEGSYNDIAVFLGACAPLILAQRMLLRLAMPVLRIIGAAPVQLAGLGAAAIMLGAAGVEVAQTTRASDRSVFAEELGFYVTPEYAADLAAMRKLGAQWEARAVPADRRLLSVYTSALDIAAGTQSPTPVGSLIHALGTRNRVAFAGLVAERKVAAVTTIAPQYSGWEGWIVRANWPFFAALQQNYRPIARNDQHVLWVRTKRAAAPLAEAQCRVEPVAANALAIRLTAARSGLASVKVIRRGPYGEGRTAMLTVTESSPFTEAQKTPPWNDFPRYGVDNTARLALAAPVEPGKPTRLLLEVLDRSAIGTAHCSAQVHAPVDYAALPGLPEGIERFLAEGGA
jgi:hypothetical protein